MNNFNIINGISESTMRMEALVERAEKEYKEGVTKAVHDFLKQNSDYYPDGLQQTERRDKVTITEQEVMVFAPQIFLFDRKVFTEQEAEKVSWEDAHELAQVEKGMRHVWQYDTSCGTFAGDFNRGCINPDNYYIRIYDGE